MNEQTRELMPEFTEDIELEWDTEFPDRPKVVCLCGSTRFRKEFDEANKQQTLSGAIVLSVGTFPRTSSGAWDPTQISDEEKRRLDLLHFRKIDLSDEIFVVNVNDYIGESTAREIAYAQKKWKKISYMYPHGES